MAKTNQIVLFNSLLLSFIILCLSNIRISCCAKQAGVARREDIPFIKCQVCEKLAMELYLQVKDKQDKISPKKELVRTNVAIELCLLIVRNIEISCPFSESHLCGVEQYEELVEQESEGYRILRYRCVRVYLQKKKPQMSSLVNFICKDLTEACSTKPPPVPKLREPGETFVPKSEKEAEM
ncbi:uncharacterized protein [Rutidosis leptorrhynchoides]|uniref:uncharacterized protein n=1 Tax=Rutidosis leptorrhynchoides TaxID=125765 RepID=UPI003A9A4A7D